MDMTTFFAYVRRLPFGGRLTQSQIDGANAIIAEWNRRGLSDVRWLAYILATAFHESAATMQPVRETLAKSDAQAIQRLETAWQKGQLKWVKTPYWRKDAKGNSWFGRGLVQITHEPNYAKFGLTANPSKALEMPTAVKVIFDGMINGMFTGKKLSDYFSAAANDPIGARAIVNGSDKAKLISQHYKAFLDAIDKAIEGDKGARPADVKIEDAKADDVPASQSGTVWTAASGLAGTAGVSLVTGISNPWAFAGLALILIVAGIFGWLVWSGRLTINRGKAAV